MLVEVHTDGEKTVYQYVKPEMVQRIVDEHLVGGTPVQEWLVDEAYERFYRKQVKVVLSDCGRIDPEDIDAYIAIGGYEAARDVLNNWTPEEVIKEIKQSGLRGRGGAGFPTGIKWELGRKAPGDIKYIICNADEGDPGAFMDRAVIEGNPHSVIEGMLIGAYAIGAHHGYVYIRAEYPLAVERLHLALKQARERGFLGNKIFGTDFDFDIKIKLGAGAFVCGEETALIASIEGQRGMPRPKPPFPVNKGLWQQPTVINNVETLANIPSIIRKGCGMVRLLRHREVERDQGLRADRQDQESGPDRGPDGDHAPGDHLGDRRRHRGRQGASKRSRPAALRAAASRQACST